MVMTGDSSQGRVCFVPSGGTGSRPAKHLESACPQTSCAATLAWDIAAPEWSPQKGLWPARGSHANSQGVWSWFLLAGTTAGRCTLK